MNYYNISYVIGLPDGADWDAFHDALVALVEQYGGEMGGGAWPVNEDGNRIDARTGKAVDDGPHA